MSCIACGQEFLSGEDFFPTENGHVHLNDKECSSNGICRVLVVTNHNYEQLQTFLDYHDIPVLEIPGFFAIERFTTLNQVKAWWLE